MSRPVCLITGGNRGIGSGICRGLATARPDADVWLGARNLDAGAATVRELEAEGLSNLRAVALDVTRPDDAAALVNALEYVDARIEVLVNNAGCASRGPELNSEIARKTLDVNYRGARDVSKALIPAMSRGGRIVNISSGMGVIDPSYDDAIRDAFMNPTLSVAALDQLVAQFEQSVADDEVEERGWAASAYKVSKAALNGLTRIWARDLRLQGLTAYSVCPGWVRTNMGGENASRSVEEGADTPIWLATETPAPPTGFYRDRAAIDW